MRRTNVSRASLPRRLGWAAVLVTLVTLVPVGPLAGIAAAAIPGTWSFTGPLAQARGFAPAVLLGDGTVITAGGTDGTSYFASAERWSSGTWSSAGSIGQAVAGQVAAPLPGGKALFAGGADATSYYTHGDVYDPASGWSQTPAMSSAHAYGASAVLQNGDVMVIGGYDGGASYVTGAVDIYDAAHGTWSAGTSLSGGRYAFVAQTMADGKVLVAGGDDGSLTSSSVLSSAYLYNGSTWTQIENMKRSRMDAAAVLLKDGRVLVAGGADSTGVGTNTSEVYDPATGHWSLTGFMSSARAGFTLTLLSDGRVLAAGGYGSSPNDALTTTDLFDPATGGWTTTGTMHVGRRYQSATRLATGEVLVLGGRTSTGTYDGTAEIFTPPPGRLTYPATTFHPITPTRILDSRYNNGLNGYFKNRVPRRFQVTGRGGVPSIADQPVVAVTGILTTTGSTAKGYLSIGPVFTGSPSFSILNFPAGDDRANNVAVALDSTGGLDVVYVGSGVTRGIFDVTGYFTADDLGATFFPLTEPKRLLDSRSPYKPFLTGVVQKFQVAGLAGVPSDALAVTGNFTLVQPTSRGWAYVGPSIPSNPATQNCSTVNSTAGDTRADGVTVKLGSDGMLSAVWVGTGGSSANLLFDVTGYYMNGTSGARFVPIEPTRLVDTRANLPFLGPIPRTNPVTVMVRYLAGTTSKTTGISGNLTVTGQTYRGYMTVAPHLDAGVVPGFSTINFPVGDNRANGFFVSLDTDGSLAFVYEANASGSKTHFIMDVTGYFEPATAPAP